MIITCASCLTRFKLDDSKVSPEGVKVRCSRCKHVFYVVPPPETKEEIIENLESFAKYHEDLMEPGEVKTESPPESGPSEEVSWPKEKDEAFSFADKTPPKSEETWPAAEEPEEMAPPEKVEMLLSEEPVGDKKAATQPSWPARAVHVDRRGPFRVLALLVVLVLVTFGILFLWSQLSSGGRLSPYVDRVVNKITELWNQISGAESGGLIVAGYTGYQEKVGEASFFVIEGKVKNKSKFTKKYIKIGVVIFDEDKLKLAEKQAVCGRLVAREDLKKEPEEFFKGEMVMKPRTEKEMIIPSGKDTPFMVIFRDLPTGAKNFKCEILEAPNL